MAGLITDPATASLRPRFLDSILEQLAPEPFEQFTYLLLLFLFFVALFLFLKVKSIKRSQSALILTKYASVPVVALSLWLQLKSEYVLFEYLEIIRVLVGLAVITSFVFALNNVLRRLKIPIARMADLSSKKALKSAMIVFVFFWTLFLLLAGLYTDSNIGNAYGSVTYHLSFYINEFAAVVSGKTNLVDFFPQYQRLLSYLLLPVFQVFGLSFTTFSVTMISLILIGMFGVYLAIISATRHFWIATICYLSLMGLSSRHVAAHGLERFYNFNYYGVSPIRYLFNWVGFAAIAFYLKRPTYIKKLVALFIAALGLMNNTDFGIFNFVGIVFTLMIFSDSDFKNRLKTGVESLLVLFITLVSYSVYTFSRSGALPDFTRSLFFQKVFATYGLSMAPMSPFGFQWVVIFVFMLAIAIGALGSNLGFRKQNVAIYALVFLSGIQGLGPFSYFVGRSMSQILIASFPAFGLSIALISLISVEHWHDERVGTEGLSVPIQVKSMSTLKWIAAKWITVFQICFFMGLGLYQNIKTPSVFEQWTRFHLSNPDFLEKLNQSIQFIQESVKHHERVGTLKAKSNFGDLPEVIVIAPFGQWLAMKAGYRNLFMYSELGSVFLESQIAEVESHLVNRPLVFADFDNDKDVEFIAMLNRQGYVPTGERGRLRLFSKATQ